MFFKKLKKPKKLIQKLLSTVAGLGAIAFLFVISAKGLSHFKHIRISAAGKLL